MELKDYKIIWLTEGFWNGKIKLDNSSVVPSMRNDVSTQYVLGAEHYPIFRVPEVLQHFGENHFDFAIVTLLIVCGIASLVKGIKGRWDQDVKPEDMVGPSGSFDTRDGPNDSDQNDTK